jgi:hypothetical protein
VNTATGGLRESSGTASPGENPPCQAVSEQLQGRERYGIATAIGKFYAERRSEVQSDITPQSTDSVAEESH